jgi:methionyl-tRNA synthetase
MLYSIPSDPLVQLMYWVYSPWFWFLVIWSLSWKGIALWKAAKNRSMPWFIALLLLNTVGILEIVYIFFFSKKKTDI